MHICLDAGGRFSFHANSIVSEPILEILSQICSMHITDALDKQQNIETRRKNVTNFYLP